MIIPTGRVQQMLDRAWATDPERYRILYAMLESLEEVLGDDPLAWWGAYTTTTLWGTWFENAVFSKAGIDISLPEEEKRALANAPGNKLSDALSHFRNSDMVMLLDAFIQDHPMTEVAIMKYDKRSEAAVQRLEAQFES